MSDDRQPYRFQHPVDVRFKDIDVGGHAHHSHTLVYFEELAPPIGRMWWGAP